MNFAQFLQQNTQQEQAPQDAQQTQEALPVDLIAAKMDADKYLSLKAQAAAAIDAGTDPAQLLVLIIGALFGESSPQAAAKKAIEAAAETGRGTVKGNRGRT